MRFGDDFELDVLRAQKLGHPAHRVDAVLPAPDVHVKAPAHRAFGDILEDLLAQQPERRAQHAREAEDLRPLDEGVEADVPARARADDSRPFGVLRDPEVRGDPRSQLVREPRHERSSHVGERGVLRQSSFSAVLDADDDCLEPFLGQRFECLVEMPLAGVARVVVEEVLAVMCEQHGIRALGLRIGRREIHPECPVAFEDAHVPADRATVERLPAQADASRSASSTTGSILSSPAMRSSRLATPAHRSRRAYPSFFSRSSISVRSVSSSVSQSSGGVLPKSRSCSVYRRRSSSIGCSWSSTRKSTSVSDSCAYPPSFCTTSRAALCWPRLSPPATCAALRHSIKRWASGCPAFDSKVTAIASTVSALMRMFPCAA